MSLKNSKNLFNFDKENLQGKDFLIGTDEAGRGPGAGGVFAAAVCFKTIDKNLIKTLSLLNDSKKLSRKTREELFEIIMVNTINSVVCVEVDEIEKTNILACSLKAMKLACENVLNQIKSKNTEENIATMTLVDGNRLIRNFIPLQKTIIKGDSKSAAIAAASILAKVSRDRYMLELDKEFPQYNWKQNAGYLTKEHLDAIDKFGLTKYHRKSFLRKHFEKQLTLF